MAQYKNLPENWDINNEYWIEFPIEIKLSKYKISTFGNIYSKYLKRNMKLKKGRGYPFVDLINDIGEKTYERVHRLVAICFIVNDQNKRTVDHIDRQTDNNKISNLKWATDIEQHKNKKIIKKDKGASIDQFDLNDKYIKTWINQKEAAKSVEGDARNISKCCTGKAEKAYGYIWKHVVQKNQEWKDIPGYPGYQASQDGFIRDSRGILLKGCMNKIYHETKITINGISVQSSTHCFIALAFLGPRSEGYVVNHKNGIKTDNRVDNLEYVTYSGNSKHAYDIGLTKHHTVKVCKLGQDGKVIEEFGSMKEAAKALGVVISAVNNAITRGHKCKGHYLIKMEDKTKIMENPYEKKKPSRIIYRIYQLDDNGKIINQFNNFIEAGKMVKLTSSAISIACRKKKKSGGFYWKKEKVNN